MKILLIAGGWSSERDISLKGAQIIAQALQNLGHTVTFFDLLTHFDSLLSVAKEHDVALINLHGRPGEDGLVQALLERVNCPYLGSDPAGSFLALHKAASKQIFRQHGLPTPDWEFLPCPPAKNWQPTLPYPLFVKSNTGGSSLHLGRATTKEELDRLLAEIFAIGEEALLETALEGKEISCGILGNRALPPILIEPAKNSFFDYESKYSSDGAREICPAPIDVHLTTEVQKLALSAHQALGLKGISRADLILETDNSLSLLEVNTLPGMTQVSLVPKEAKAIGLSFEQLLAEMLKLTLDN